MQFFARLAKIFAAIAVLPGGLCIAAAATKSLFATPSAHAAESTISQPPSETCQPRTINYITHSLPQVCLRYTRTESGTHASGSPMAAESVVIPRGNTLYNAPIPSVAANASDDGFTTFDLDSDSALDESSFLSFEEWKRQTLEKESLTDSIIGDRRYKDGERRRSPESIQDALKALEDDDVLDPHFTTFLGESYGDLDAQVPHQDVKDGPDGVVTEDVPLENAAGQRNRYRSKDAGKTCKERFNFASLDAGAQIMKTNPEAKSASALLKEDRDVYMLNACQAKNKFLIVELSESILVETLGIANFEFFSSTFKLFKISVSDRYPVKLDRWVDLGTFEARNSRDIQAFLIKDARIWARYLRVEFLSHYGNEFYCPVSLLRVHGRTMIQDVLSMEEATRGEEDSEDELEDTGEGSNEHSLPEVGKVEHKEKTRIAEDLEEAEAAIEELVKTAEAITASKPTDFLNLSQIQEVKQLLESVSLKQMTTSWVKPDLGRLFNVSDLSNICLASNSSAPGMTTSGEITDSADLFMESAYHRNFNLASNNSSEVTPLLINLDNPIDIDTVNMSQFSKSVSSQNMPSLASSFLSVPASQAVSITPAANTGSTKSLNKSSTTLASQHSQPTTQESFFKTVTKRLQLLEANSTLSLKYIEEQSKILRDAFTKVERRQLSKTTSFLENLNATVLEELRRFSQQYDQIWQSTVIELETQREQSQREIAAISTRLSLLADELVFQKRMSIVQSMLLLLCLGLVIFSKGPGGAYLDLPIVQNLIAKSGDPTDLTIDSGSSSPDAQKNGVMRQDPPWYGLEHRRHKSDDSAGSLRLRSRAESPSMPLSSYSMHEEEGKSEVSCREVPMASMGESLVAHRVQDPPQHTRVADRLHLEDDKITIEEDSSRTYPDFKDSALWLSSDPLMYEGERADSQRYMETELGSGRHSQGIASYGLGFSRPPIMNVDEDASEDTVDSSALPSPPPAKEKPEFSIARKPLPALPVDDQ